MRERVILLVEDSPEERELITACLEDSRFALDVHAVINGDQALQFLRREGARGDAPRPDLVLLDLNMPSGGGHEVLTERAEDPALGSIPVIVFSGSSSDDDVELAYALGANSYVDKPVGLGELRGVLEVVLGYWFGPVRIPTP